MKRAMRARYLTVAHAAVGGAAFWLFGWLALGVVLVAAGVAGGLLLVLNSRRHWLYDAAGEWRADPDLRESVEEIARDFGFARAEPRVAIVEGGSSPAMAGGGRQPLVIIRGDYADVLTAAEARAVIGHELGERRLRSRELRVAIDWAAGVVSALIVAGALESRHWLILTSLLVPLLGRLLLYREIEFAADRYALRAAGSVAAASAIEKAQVVEANRRGRGARSASPHWLDSPDLLSTHPSVERRIRSIGRSATQPPSSQVEDVPENAAAEPTDYARDRSVSQGQTDREHE